MTFFARPDLSSVQFKQLPGSELTLSGQTRIATVSGLTLSDGVTGNIIITASGASSLSGGTHVLTYDGAGKIKLMPSASIAGLIYSGDSPSTCTVGGLSAGTTIYGRTIACILEDILVPTMNPTVTAPSVISFTICPSTTIYEIGTVTNITGYTSFSRGCIIPQYCGACCYRSGDAIYYNYYPFGIDCIVSNAFTCDCTSFGSYLINSPSNSISVCVTHSSGATPAYNSSGGIYYSALTSGFTNICCRSICGIYPWFWGNSVTVPDISTSACTQSLITGGSKCVGISTGDIVVTNYNVCGEYIWFAIPTLSTSKTKWQGCNSPSNCGTIPGDLFGSECCQNINSPENCWTGQTYGIYVSNYPTSINYGMVFKNS
jgi:hypothetical protein